MAPKQRYLDLPAAANYLGVTPEALRKKVDRGQMPYIRIDRRLRFDVTDLDHWMRRHRIEAST